LAHGESAVYQMKDLIKGWFKMERPKLGIKLLFMPKYDEKLNFGLSDENFVNFIRAGRIITSNYLRMNFNNTSPEPPWGAASNPLRIILQSLPPC